jgi:hypothetical protein
MFFYAAMLVALYPRADAADQTIQPRQSTNQPAPDESAKPSGGSDGLQDWESYNRQRD